MTKTNVVVSCPIDTYSGYGARSRDFVKALIDTGKYDVKIVPQRWGQTRWGYLKDHDDTIFSTRLVTNLTQQPDVWIQITIPNEFVNIGKYNIGVTAGIETTMCDPSWIKGCNKMDLVIGSTNHTVESFKRSRFDLRNEKTGQVAEKIEIKTKLEVLFEGADIEKYRPLKEKGISEVSKTLDSIPETFCFLTTGHWMQGDFGEDRKNLGFTIKAFLETFKNKQKQPALVMKSHCSTTSIMDRERILDKIDEVRKTVRGKLPNIYLIHGEVTDEEMNEIYNHHKIKALVSLPKGEGFGRPFLEFSLVNKPIIASSWSGQTDFLNKDYIRYVRGQLSNVHPSAAVKNILLQESQWFSPDPIDVGKAFKEVYKDYKNWVVKAKKQGRENRLNFSYENMVEELGRILDNNLPTFAREQKLSLGGLNLPKLKKVEQGNKTPEIKLPKLKKV